VADKHQTFTVDIDEEIPRYIVCDDQRLAQVITNVLGNAVKFTPEQGSVQLIARLMGRNNGMCKIQVDVTDTGVGISDEQMSRLFKSFEQADSGTSRKFGGSGLGLVISKRIVEMMGGDIWVESELGKGSTFSITVWVEEPEEASDEITPHLSGSPKEQVVETDCFEGYRVLLAEDIAVNREIVLALLEPTKLAIDCVENGREALQRFSEDPDAYDMIFMDVQMPEMDGYEATRRIRALDNLKAQSIPIVAMTANVFREDIEQCLEAGMNGHVGKPLHFDEVLETLRTNLL